MLFSRYRFCPIGRTAAPKISASSLGRTVMVGRAPRARYERRRCAVRALPALIAGKARVLYNV